MRRRSAAIAALIAAAAAAFSAAPAEAGGFRFSQCNAVAGGGLSPRSFQAGLWWVANGWATANCGAGGGTVQIGTGHWRLPESGTTVAGLSLPGALPRTSARAAWLDWRLNAQAPSANPAFLTVTAGGARIFDARAGTGTAPGGATRHLLPTGSRGLEFMVYCSTANGPGWCAWDGYPFEVRGVTLELEEDGEPSATAAGPLVGGGEHAGVVPLEILATDGDSGVRRVSVSLAGVPVGTLEPPEPCTDDRLPPCPQTLRGTLDVDTRLVPDGARRLRLVVVDAAGNSRTIDAATVAIANRPVVNAPQDPGSGPGPGLGSGGGTGAAPPAAGGTRTEPERFPPNPLAGRGHVANGRHASERARLAAWLEPDRRARRRGVTVPYGVRVRIRGRLTDERGRGIGRATLATIRREPGRPWRVVTGVRTRPDGRFTAFSRIGPSQALRFVYYAYGDSARGRNSPTLRVWVVR
jgi:hypothetical protein